MTTLRAGDLVRRKDQTADQQEMTVTQISGTTAHVAWFDADGDHTFTTIPADELWTSVEAAKVARARNEAAKADHAALNADHNTYLEALAENDAFDVAREDAAQSAADQAE